MHRRTRIPRLGLSLMWSFLGCLEDRWSWGLRCMNKKPFKPSFTAPNPLTFPCHQSEDVSKWTSWAHLTLPCQFTVILDVTTDAQNSLYWGPEALRKAWAFVALLKSGAKTSSFFCRHWANLELRNCPQPLATLRWRFRFCPQPPRCSLIVSMLGDVLNAQRARVSISNIKVSSAPGGGARSRRSRRWTLALRDSKWRLRVESASGHLSSITVF